MHKVERQGNNYNPNRTDSFIANSEDFGDESIVGRAIMHGTRNEPRSTYRPALFTQGSPLEQTPRQMMQQRVNIRTQGRDKTGGGIQGTRASEPSYLNNTQGESTVFSSFNNGNGQNSSVIAKNGPGGNQGATISSQTKVRANVSYDS